MISSSETATLPAGAGRDRRKFHRLDIFVRSSTLQRYGAGARTMRRRDVIAIIAGIAVLPLAAHAQQGAASIATGSTDVSKCAQNSAGFPQALDGPRWNGWGADLGNTRFQPAAMAGLTI